MKKYIILIFLLNSAVINLHGQHLSRTCNKDDYNHRHFQNLAQFCRIELVELGFGKDVIFNEQRELLFYCNVREISKETFENVKKNHITIKQYNSYYPQMEYLIDSITSIGKHKQGEYLSEKDLFAYNELFIESKGLEDIIELSYRKPIFELEIDSTNLLVTLTAKNGAIKQLNFRLVLYEFLFEDYYPKQSLLLISLCSEFGGIGEVLFNTKTSELFQTVGETNSLTSDSLLCFSNIATDQSDFIFRNDEVIEIFDLEKDQLYRFKLDSLISELNTDRVSNDSVMWALGEYYAVKTRVIITETLTITYYDIYFIMELIVFNRDGERKVLETKYFSLNPRDLNFDHLKNEK